MIFMNILYKARRNMAVLFLPLLVSSCSGSVDTGIFNIFSSSEPQLPCPQVEILPGADTITIFREGEGRDLIDVRFEGALAPVSGNCQYVDDDTAVVVDLVLRIDAVKGPAAESSVQEFPFFVAIADQYGKVLAKKIFNSPIEIAGGQRRGAVQEEIDQRIPLPGGKSGANYVIILGFQFTKEQFDRRVNS
jgi:hypothetical protein